MSEPPIVQNLKPAIKALENHIKSQPYGTFISFKELKLISGVDIQDYKYRYILETAKRTLLRHHDRVLISIRGKGYEIGETSAVIAESAGYRKKSYNAAKKAFQIIKTIDLSTLQEAEKIKVINEQCKGGLLLVAYKATENQLLNNPEDGLKLAQPTENSIIKILLERAQNK